MSPFKVKTSFALLSLLFSLLFLSACTTPEGEAKRDISTYYYPFKQLEKGGIVYAYDSKIAKAGISNTEYWYVQLLETDSGAYVVSTYYDPSLTQGLNTVDRVVDNGTVLDKIFFYEFDTTTNKRMPIEGVIESGSNYPFEVTDSTGLFLYSVKYHPYGQPDTWNYLIRNKRFYGDGPSFDFKGKKLKTVQFKIKEVVGSDNQGAAELEGKGEQRFAEGLGLVYYKKEYKGYRQEYELVDTFSMDQLISKHRAKMIEAAQ